MVAPNKKLTAAERAALREKLKSDRSFMDKLTGDAPWEKDPALYDPKKEPPQNPELARRLAVAKPAYAKKFGEELPIRSEVRSYDQQYNEYQRYLKNKASGFKLSGYPTLANNPNEHPGVEWFHANAFDGPRDVKKAAFLQQFGFKRPYSNDAVHYELETNWKPKDDIKSAYKAAHGYEPEPYKADNAATRLLGKASAVKDEVGRIVNETIGSFGKKSATDKWNEDITKFNSSPQRQADAKIIEKEEDKSTILPKGFLRAMAMSETGINRDASNPSGARGPFQFMPSTGKGYGLVEYGKDGKIVRDDRNDVAKSAAAARQYAEMLWKRYGGDVDKVVAAYNMGEGNLDKNYSKGWDEGETPGSFPRESQQHVAKFRHHFRNIAGENIANTVLPKERPWLKADAPPVGQKTKTAGKGLGVNAPPSPNLATESKTGLQPVAPRTYATNGPSRMPGEANVAFQQPERSDLQQGIEAFKSRQAAEGGTPLYGGPAPTPNSPLGEPGEVNQAMRDFAAVKEPSGGLSSQPAAETFTAGPVTQPSTLPYQGQSVPNNIFTPDPSTYLQAAPEASPYAPGNYSPASNIPSNVFTPRPEMYPRPAPDIYAGIEGGMEGNPPWPSSGPLAPQRPSSYVEQNPSRDVFNSYAVQQPMPTYDSGRYNPVPSAPMYQGRMVEQPAPRAMEPFTPRSTYAEQQVPRDILTPRPETYFRPAPETPMVPQGRSMYAEQTVPNNVFTPNPDAYYRPAPLAPSYDSGNYQAASDVPVDVFSRYSVQQPAPGRVSMSFPPPPQDSGNYIPVPSPQLYSGQMVQQPAPVEPSSRFGSYYGSPYEAQQQVRTTTPEPTFPEYKYDWYDQLMSIQKQPPVEDWQNQLDSYYMDKYGVRYQPELQGPERSAPPPTIVPKSYPPQDIDLDEPAASALGTVNWARRRQ